MKRKTIARSRAFSLIELLVVLAVIGVLAAILSPVISSGKRSAKRVVDISRLRQISMAMLLYANDSDDSLPLGFMVEDDQTWKTYNLYPIPPDWEPDGYEEYYRRTQTVWANAITSYLRSTDVLSSRAGRDRYIERAIYERGRDDYIRTNFQFNGLLSSYQHSSITAPSELPMISQNRGEMNLVGYFTTSPRLVCTNVGPCRFSPARRGCGFENGSISHMLFSPFYSQWVHGKGQLVAFADGSAKWRSMDAPPNLPSDYTTMYWTRLNKRGISVAEWREEHGCHTLLFQPDFDFADFGNPIEEPSAKYSGRN